MFFFGCELKISTLFRLELNQELMLKLTKVFIRESFRVIIGIVHFENVFLLAS
jgi:hypothetical protein